MLSDGPIFLESSVGVPHWAGWVGESPPPGGGGPDEARSWLRLQDDDFEAFLEQTAGVAAGTLRHVTSAAPAVLAVWTRN